MCEGGEEGPPARNPAPALYPAAASAAVAVVAAFASAASVPSLPP